MKALIVDDEQFCRDNLRILIEEYCPEITGISMSASAEEARASLGSETPDILFLDIKMPKESGFDLLQSLGDHNMSVIFTTAHNEYALDALKARAVDYLEKPINIDDLQVAVAKIENQPLTSGNSLTEIKALIQQAYQDQSNEKIAIPMREGYEIISYRDIVHLEAQESYTMIYLESGKKLLSSKNIKVYEEKLDSNIFFRTHKSHIVNIRHHLKSFNRIDGNSAVMSGGKYIPIARRKLQSFLDRIAGM